MWKTVLRRVLIMIPEIIILSVFVFILAKMMPGDPFTGAITPQTSPARIHELKVQAGLYDPWYVQYGRWITNLFHGDLGISYQFKTPVAGLIASRAGNTLWLSLVIVVLSYLFAIPLGIIAGRFENSKSDRVIQLYNYISYAIQVSYSTCLACGFLATFWVFFRHQVPFLSEQAAALATL